MSKPKEPKKPFNPRVRANVYALAALYLVYLFYQIAKPYLTHDPYGPTKFQFVLGSVVLGGGAVALGLLGWKMFKAPLPEELQEPEEEGPALPEEAGEDGEDPEEDPEDD